MSTPAGTVDNISIGSGIVYRGLAGVTPATDVGYLGNDGITLAYETETVAVTVGFPAVPVRRFVSSVNARVQFQSYEWNLANFEAAVTGSLVTTTTTETLSVGLDACPDEATLKIEFQMPCVNDTFEISCWRAQTDGALSVQLRNDAPHTFDYNFELLLATEKWDATALDASAGLFEIVRTLAA